MQITIDKKSGIFIGIIAGLLVIIMALVMPGGSSDGFFGMHRNDSGKMNHHSSRGLADLTSADIMFLQMMIPHHQQAVDISDLALKKSSDAELLALAKEIRDAQASEIIAMKAWLKDAGVDLEMDHSMGHGMGGMLSDSDLAALKNATGKNFDVLWLKGMTGHHDGALHMTTMIEDAINPEIKNFGQAIVSSQSAQITQMAAMLKRLG